MTLPLLLEIGTEEIPDWMIVSAVNQFRESIEKLLATHKLEGTVSRADATPRRIALNVNNVLTRQSDAEELVMGPPASAGPKAAEGFAKKNKVSPTELRTEKTDKGEYFAILKKVTGRATKDILAEALPGIILGIYFPKTMYWTGKGGPRFIRPIRWIVALLGEEVIPFELAGVTSGNTTQGHRRLAKQNPIQVTIETYEQSLNENGVILSSKDRRQRILDGIAKFGVNAKTDEALLDTLVYITEYPTPILGHFEPEYLSLPEEVLITVMRHHQKYFSVNTDAGKLAPNFIAVMNIDGDPDGIVKHGNQRVLRARFNDARFFWDSDQKTKLADRVSDLAKVTFQAKLGSYLDKTNRMVELVRELGGNEHAERAATLSKCDLTTDMVKEFTELQGIVGGLYARAQGEPEAVAQAVYDHYKPTSMEDSIPSTPEGRIVALADKIDTLRGCFGIGLIPSGSKDPFALRRAAQGVVKILLEGNMAVPLRKIAAGNTELHEFLLDRIRYYFKEVRGFAYDEVNAVLAAGCEDLPDAEKRLAAIKAVRITPDFEPLAASFKRIKNILRQAGRDTGGDINASLLEPGPEAALHAAFEKLRYEVNTRRDTGDYGGALSLIASLRPQVDTFFDKVLVNAQDEKVKNNRLTLLANLLTEFSTIADFSEIVTSSQ